eukprot:c28958_g1_i10 orf=427-990(+)
MGDDDLNGKFCYFHRDLSHGSYGSDVTCLQQYLKHQGFLCEEPSGFFGPTTVTAVTRWQVANHLYPPTGLYEFTSRGLYAKKNNLPSAEELLALEVQAQGGIRTCIDVVCMDADGGEFCQIACLKRGSSVTDKMHLCQQACQVAAGEACDRVFPPTQPRKYKKCLSLVARSCKQACQKALEKGTDVT